MTAATPMEVLVHVLLADGEPLPVSELWLPAGSPLSAADAAPLLGVAPPPELVGIVDESVLPAVADGETAAALNLPADAAVFCADQLIEAHGQPAAWHRAFIRPLPLRRPLGPRFSRPMSWRLSPRRRRSGLQGGVGGEQRRAEPTRRQVVDIDAGLYGSTEEAGGSSLWTSGRCRSVRRDSMVSASAGDLSSR